MNRRLVVLLAVVLSLAAATPALAQEAVFTITTASVASTDTTRIPGGTGAFSTFIPTDPFTGSPAPAPNPIVAYTDIVETACSQLSGTVLKLGAVIPPVVCSLSGPEVRKPFAEQSVQPVVEDGAANLQKEVGALGGAAHPG
jgi:hypothetical protein